MKAKRHQRILEIIEHQAIETQEELLKCLLQAGFEVTQATISRDIRELNLLKGTTADGKYKYIQSAKSQPSANKFNHALTDSIVSVESAQNMVVVKTYAGMAQALGTCIDSLQIPEMLGCVAGDDTIIIVFKTCSQAESMGTNLTFLIRKLTQ